MVDSGEAVDVGSLPLAPKSPLPYWQRWRAARAYHTGCETLRDAGGPVTRNSLGPKWMLPPYVVTTSPKGARDVLSRSYPFVDRELPVFDEQRRLNGGSTAARCSTSSTTRGSRADARCNRYSPSST